MRSWAIRLITYPVVFLLALILIGPTFPIDMSILLITGIVAMLGLSNETSVLLDFRPHLAEWRRSVLARLPHRHD
jgi:hypothetical protein